MTVTDQGTSIRCDHPQCSLPATVEVGAWGYCALHAADPAAPPPAATTPTPEHLTRAHTAPAIVSSSNGQPHGANSIAGLLATAAQHSNPRVKKAGEKAQALIDDLRVLVDSLAEEERRKQEEAAEKEQARLEVERLEQELAAARARLTGRAPRPASAAPAAEPRTCKDCGGQIVREPGSMGRPPTRCAECKAKAA